MWKHLIVLRCALMGIFAGVILCASASIAQTTRPTESAADIYKRVTRSLVAVQWIWAYEYGRAEYVGAGVVVRDDGLIAIPMQVADPGIPDSQMGEFKIIIPATDDRDEQ